MLVIILILMLIEQLVLVWPVQLVEQRDFAIVKLAGILGF